MRSAAERLVIILLASQLRSAFTSGAAARFQVKELWYKGPIGDEGLRPIVGRSG
jgi:hypothetical protein